MNIFKILAFFFLISLLNSCNTVNTAESINNNEENLYEMYYDYDNDSLYFDEYDRE